MDITRRLIGTSGILKESQPDIVGVDLDSIIRRLILFDTYILKTIKLEEFHSLLLNWVSAELCNSLSRLHSRLRASALHGDPVNCGKLCLDREIDLYPSVAANTAATVISLSRQAPAQLPLPRA